MPDLKITALAVILGFCGGWAVNGWRLNASFSAERIDAAETARVALAEMTADRDRTALRLLASNDRQWSDLKKAQDETNRFRDASAYGLRIGVNCAPRLDARPAPSSGLDIGKGAELDTTTRRAYFALRDGIDRASAQLAACQAELTIRLPPPVQPAPEGEKP